MTPARADADPTAADAARERLAAAVAKRDAAIEAANREFWQAVDAEIRARTLTQTAAAATLDYSRENVRVMTARHRDGEARA
jgi:hypothetical protein